MKLSLKCPGHPAKVIEWAELQNYPDEKILVDIGVLFPGRSGVAVLLHAVLEQAFPNVTPAEVTLRNTGENYFKSIPYALIRQSAWLVHSWEGQPLPPEKGGPFRLLVPETKMCGTAELDNCVNVKGLDEIAIHAE